VKRHTSRGFTLVEVLVAFVILSIVLVTLYDILSQSLQRQSRSARHLGAIFLAESLLSQVGVEGLKVSDGANDQYHWRVIAAPLQEELFQDYLGVELRPYVFTVVVLWDESSDSKRISLSTVRLISERQAL